MNEKKKPRKGAHEDRPSNGEAQDNPHSDPAGKGGAHPSTGFDLGRFRLSQNFTEQAGVRKLLTTVPVRKPDKQAFVYVHPDPNFRVDVAMIELREEREFFLVDPEVLPAVYEDTKPYTLVTYATRSNAVCLWPIRLPGDDGKDHGAWESAREAATEHAGRWIRIQWNAQLGAYDIWGARRDDLPEPDWPEVDFDRLIELAFRKAKRIVDSEDHIVVRKLRGEV